MSQIKAKGTNLEKTGWNLLKEAKVSFRKHPKNIFGKPDAGNKSRKIAVFFDSNFWHGYNWIQQKKTIKSKKKFWIQKIERNIQRDKAVTALLKKEGWKVVRLWERDLLMKNKAKVILKLQKIWKDRNL